MNMLNRALIIFVRQPVPGKVKTRLAKTTGDEKALEIYRDLLAHTRSITKALDCDKYVFYADGIAENDLWENDLYRKHLQTGNDLGERMLRAFKMLFEQGYTSLCIIGSDCFELTANIIGQAFDFLKEAEVVIGPSNDGGYYLLGLTRLQPALFTHIDWSTPQVLHQTVNKCHAGGLAYLLLPALDDIDEEGDWLRHQQKLQA